MPRNNDYRKGGYNKRSFDVWSVFWLIGFLRNILYGLLLRHVTADAANLLFSNLPRSITKAKAQYQTVMELSCTYNSRVATAKKIIAKVEQKYQGIEINLGTACNIAGRTFGRGFKKQLAKYLQNRIKAVQVQA